MRPQSGPLQVRATGYQNTLRKELARNIFCPQHNPPLHLCFAPAWCLRQIGASAASPAGGQPSPPRPLRPSHANYLILRAYIATESSRVKQSTESSRAQTWEGCRPCRSLLKLSCFACRFATERLEAHHALLVHVAILAGLVILRAVDASLLVKHTR